MLQSAVEHYKRQQRLTAAALSAARRKNLSPAELARIVAAIQVLAAQDALNSIQPMLDEQNISAPLNGTIPATGFAGTASDGRPLESLLGAASTHDSLGMMVVTQIQDAARQAAAVSIAARPRIGYVRMLNAPSCSRCAVLAGKFYGYNAGFARHPRCDCRHIPSTEDRAGSLTTSPDGYFQSLPSAAHLDAKYPELTVKMRNDLGLVSQEDIFGRAGAQAIRQGADISQVVNARRGMQTAAEAGLSPGAIAAQKRLYGQADRFTTEGTTKRGVFGRAEIERAGGGNVTRTGRRQGYIANQSVTRTKRGRLMPESILGAAKSREDAQRLLRLYGYIF